MAYGSGGGSPYNGSEQRNQDGLSNRYSSPYQKSGSGGGDYNPPPANYAQQQTQAMEDTMRTHYEVREGHVYLLMPWCKICCSFAFQYNSHVSLAFYLCN